MSVGVNPPKTPVTKGSSGIAAATIPNICKMPGPPAPFIPTPLPNIGRSELSPDGYTTTVQVEGAAVAIKGASFKSQGDVASQGTGGGIVSSNVEGPTKFVGPGSMDVKFEGGNVQLLGNPMLNNCGPSGSPANAATMGGVVQAPAPGSPPEDPKCAKIAKAIDDLINTVRPPTPPGGMPQGYQGLATRWAEFAENKGKWGPGEKLNNHLNEYRKHQKRLQKQIQDYEDNDCGNKGPPLPPLAKEYSTQEPVPGGPLSPTPAPVTQGGPLSIEALAKSIGVSTTLVVAGLVISRIIRLFPPLWPLEASPL